MLPNKNVQCSMLPVIMRLQGARESFIEMLQEVSREIVQQDGISVALTPESLSSAATRVKGKIESSQQQRTALLESLIDTAAASDPAQEVASRERFDRLSAELARLQQERERAELRHGKTKDRLAEIDQYKQTVEQELARMTRATAAGEVLGGLKVTHCPACDQAVSQGQEHTGVCYVCKQAISSRDVAEEELQQRVKFELEQLQGELQEADELLGKLSAELARERSLVDGIGERITAIRVMLRPLQHAAATILPPDIALLDVQTGKLQEELAQLERLKRALERRERLSKQIAEMERDVVRLKGEVAKQKHGMKYERAADLLADGMNTYLNEIERLRPGSWPAGPVWVRLGDRRFDIGIGSDHWRGRLGGTLTLYFLFAYHYSLLRLAPLPECYYPGIVLLDVLAEIEGEAVADKENFVLEPFIELLDTMLPEGCQVIATGAAFTGLAAPNRIELARVWG